MDGSDPNEGYRSAATLLIVADEPASARAAEDAAALAGSRVVARSDFQRIMGGAPTLAALDIVLIEAAHAEPAMLDRLLMWGQSLAERYGSRLVVCFDEGQLDQVAAQATGPGVQLLCEPDAADRVAALAIAGRPQTVQFHDGLQENESERLRRLSDEVARIAEALTRLTLADGRDSAGGYQADGYGRVDGTSGANRSAYDGGGLPNDGRDRSGAPQHKNGGVAPAREPHLDGGDGPLGRSSAIRATIRARRLRAQFFDAQLFADPAWDMLLDLTAARLERASVSVSSLCIAAAVPPTTALRWITTMTEAGLFERQDDPLDRRRAYIALSEKAFDGMQGYAGALHRLGLHVL